MRTRLLLISFLICISGLIIITKAKGYLFAENPDTLKPKKILIASEPDYPPYCIIQNGKPSGFSVDLFLAAAKAVNLEVEIKIGIWEKIKDDLAKGRIDALPLVGKTPEREELYDFTLPYLSLHGAIFVREDSKIKSINDLKDKEILVMKGDNAEEYIRRKNLTKHIFTTNTFQEAFKHLSEGYHDAVITQRIMGIELLKEIEIDNIIPLDIQISDYRQDFCFAVQKGNSPLLMLLNEGLSVIIANGTYDEIHLKWFGPSDKGEIPFMEVVKIALYIIIPLIIIFIIVLIVTLRKQVRSKTKSLIGEIEGHKKTVRELHNHQLFLEEIEKIAKTGGWEYDLENETTSATKGISEIYETTIKDLKPSEIKSLFDYFESPGKEEIRKSFYNLLSGGEEYDIECGLITAKGNKKWVRAAAKAELKEGKVQRVFGKIMDITEHKRANDDLKKLKNELEQKVSERTEELNEKVEKLNKSQRAMLFMVEDLNKVTAELNEERKKLEASNKELEAFSYSVSHDLRAPLRAVTGFAQLLMEDYYNKIDKEGQELINDILTNAKNMGLLIEDLLQFSRLNRKEIVKEVIDMEDLFKSIGEEIKAQYVEKKTEINIGNLPKAQGDYRLIRQVVINLMNNAAKFSSNREVIKISVSGEEIKDVGSKFRVKDNGVGFDMKYHDKMFEVFQRLHKQEEYEGTGVGLAIVHRIIKRHGGMVNAISEPGKGAEFIFTIPCDGTK